MGIPLPRAKSRPVEERVMRRDFIPAGEALTEVEEARSESWSIDPADIAPQWLPDDEAQPTEPLGDPDKQQAVAAALIKKRNKAEAKEEASGAAHLERMNRLAELNVGDTVALIKSKSQHERQLWLEAEKATRKRKTVLVHFGVS